MSYIDISFESSGSKYEDPKISSLLDILINATQDEQIKRTVTDLLLLYESSHNSDQELRNVVIELFHKYHSNRIIKKFLQEQLTKLNVQEIIKSAINDLELKMVNDKICNVKQFTNFQHFLYITNNSKRKIEGYFYELFKLYVLVFEGFVYQARTNFVNVVKCEDLILLMNSVFKQILSMFVKNDSLNHIAKDTFVFDLIKLSYEVLKCDTVGFDIKTKCGLLLVHSLMMLPTTHLTHFEYHDLPALELIKNAKEQNWIQLDDHTFENILNENNKIIIYSAIFNVLQDKHIDVKINEKSFVLILYQELIECAERSTNNPPQIIEVSRILHMLMKHLKKLPEGNLTEVFKQGLQFIWAHIEHFVDTVRNYTRLIFVDLVSLAAYYSNNGSNEYFDILLSYINVSSKNSAVRYIAMECIATAYSGSILLKYFPNAIQELLVILSDTTLKHLASKIYITLTRKHFQEVDAEKWQTIWVDPIMQLLKTGFLSSLEYQDILSESFKIYPVLLRKLFGEDRNYNTQEIIVLLRFLKIARTSDIKLPQDNQDQDYWRGLIKKEQMNKFIFHQEDEIRIGVLSTIIETQKSTDFFVSFEFELLLCYLKYNITSQVPNIRKQQITFYKHALARYEASYNVILRNIKKTKNSAKLEEIYKKGRYEHFLQRFTEMLIRNLSRDANYSRRSSSLELLLETKPLIKEEMWKNCWSKSDASNCLYLLYDSFEPNKQMALQVLKMLPLNLLGFDNLENTTNFIQHCMEMARDIKPSATLSAAYMFQICPISPHFKNIINTVLSHSCDLEDPNFYILLVLVKMLKEINCDVKEFSDLKTSQYGIILSMRYILQNRNLKENHEQYSILLKEITALCLLLKTYIMPIVCNPSPEGYLPEHSESLEIVDGSAQAQKVLVYAWRTMKEMTLLLAEIISQSVKMENTCILLDHLLAIDVANFFINIFIESKHRGVFEQAYVGFSSICKSFWSSRSKNLNHLPKIWLSEALGFCIGEKQTDKLCATRRSAGLPFLILSILTTDPSHDKQIFHSTMKTLLKCCQNTSPENNEYRTHCLNILRAIFRHSKLGELVSIYIGEGVILSITGFESPTWGVRNSSTLLYSALMTRMFGVQRTQDSDDLTLKNRLTFRVFFLRHPELFEFLLNRLSEECSKPNSLILHPILMILARLYPSHIEEYNTQMQKYLKFITIAITNPVYRTRELAARGSIPLISVDEVPKCLEFCFEQLRMEQNNNTCHGHLLQVWHLLRTHKKLEILELDKYLNTFSEILEKVGTKFSHLTVTLYMDVILNLLLRMPHIQSSKVEEILTGLKNILFKANHLNTCRLIYHQTLLRLWLLIIFKKQKIRRSDVEILLFLDDSNILMQKYLLQLILSLNIVFYDHIKKHPLIDSEAVTVPQEISELVSSLDKQCIEKFLTVIHEDFSKFLSKQLLNLHNNINREENVFIGMLLTYYPCVLQMVLLVDNNILGNFIKLCNVANEEMICVLISCVTYSLDKVDNNLINIEDFINILVESASPAAADFRRLAVCEFLVTIQPILERYRITAAGVEKLLNMWLVLSEDDDVYVRNSLENLLEPRTRNYDKLYSYSSRHRIIPEKIKEQVLHLSCELLPKDCAINFLFSWCCRYFPEYSVEESEIFERGELNLFAENILIEDTGSCLLKNLLEPDDHKLSNQIKDITKILINALSKYPSPMMSAVSKNKVLDHLNLIVVFVKNNKENDFKHAFSNYFTNEIVNSLYKEIKTSDCNSILKLLEYIYDI